MSNTTHLQLPYLLASQAQKHVTHNEALRLLDAMVQLAVLDRDLTAPPGSPADGDRYIVVGRRPIESVRRHPDLRGVALA
jgi:hypothetical protein